MEFSAILPEQVKVLSAGSKDTVWVEVLYDKLIDVDVGRAPTTAVETAVEPVLGTVRVVTVGVAPATLPVVDAECAPALAALLG